MRSEKLGNATSAEVTNISSHGIWIYWNGTEYFAPYDQFPWFREAPIAKVLEVETPAPGHFYWPELDVDLSAEILTNPERFTLVARG